jgi:hypothetical protein
VTAPSTPAAPQQPAAAPPPPASPNGPPGPAANDDRPATASDIRSLRRWLAVTAIWAVAATAIAVLAYLAANDDDEQRIADTGAQSRALQRRINQQVQQLETRLETVPSSQSVTELRKTVVHLERVFARQDKQLISIDLQLKDLRSRVETLETAAPGADGTTTTPP